MKMRKMFNHPPINDNPAEESGYYTTASLARAVDEANAVGPHEMMAPPEGETEDGRRYF